MFSIGNNPILSANISPDIFGVASLAAFSYLKETCDNWGSGIRIGGLPGDNGSQSRG